MTQELLKEYISYDRTTGDMVWIKKTSNLSRVKIGDKVGYVGPTLMNPWLPKGTEGIITDVYHPSDPFPYICDFNINDGEDWPMTKEHLEKID